MIFRGINSPFFKIFNKFLFLKSFFKLFLRLNKFNFRIISK